MNKTPAITTPRKGFTLAEVLVTLAIVGVLASMTIPTLLQNLNSAQYKVAYKKAYSTGMQAMLTAYNNGNMVSRTAWNDGASNMTNFNAFKAQFNVIKDCSSENNSNCWKSGGDNFFVSRPIANALAFIDSSGMVWSLLWSDAATTQDLLVDVNGDKGPNKSGQDRFIFMIQPSDGASAGTPSKLTPFSSDYTTSNPDADRCPTPPCYYNSWLYN